MRYIATPSSPAIREAMSQGLLACMTTPIQGNRIPEGAYWAADNGKFGNGWIGHTAWFAWLKAKVAAQGTERCLFATAPDVVGDAEATLVESLPWLQLIRSLGIPAAFVAQDGCTFADLIPWGEFDVLFLGGSDFFKIGAEGKEVCAEATRRGVSVHMGRVNSRKRMRLAAEWGCCSVDGTLLSFGPDKHLEPLVRWLAEIA